MRRLAIKAKAMAEVRDRDIHATPTPREADLRCTAVPGRAVIASKLPGMAVVFGSNRQPWRSWWIDPHRGARTADDRFGLDAPTKFAGQALAAGSMAFLGIQMVWLPIGGTLVLDPLTSVLLTVLFVVLTINAVNFVDGLDGLAAGIVGIAATAFFVYAFLLSVEFGFDRATLAALICARCWRASAWVPPAQPQPRPAVHGDTGSMLIGLLLAASAITPVRPGGPQRRARRAAPGDPPAVAATGGHRRAVGRRRDGGRAAPAAAAALRPG